ncbi:MAG: flagellin FliC3 [Lachnospiraceae bacterium]|nr:flagellin FliC3 [Lachnospiraceae bacterium]
MKVNSNIQAMIAGNVLKNNEIRQSDSTRKLSSGYKINKAKDNPAGMAISNRMRAQIQSLNRANQNASNAVNVIETAEGALGEIQAMIQRMSELSVKAANGTNTTEDRVAIQAEIKQLTSEIQRVAKDTEYNGQNLLGGEQALKGYVTDPAALGLSVVDYDPDFPIGKKYDIEFSKTTDADGNTVIDKTSVVFKVDDVATTGNIEVNGDKITVTNADGAKLTLKAGATLPDSVSTGLELNGIGGMTIQVGSSEGQEINIVIPEISLDNLGIEKIDVRTEEGAQKALEQTKYALSFISSVRSRLGAYENRFENTISNLDVAEENLTKSYSTIKDVDMADEMVEYTTLQVLVQAGTSMLSQANEQPQQALQLLQ